MVHHYTRISGGKLHQLMQGKTITLAPEEHEASHGGVMIKLDVPQATATRIARANAKKKGVRLGPHEVHQLHVQVGDGFEDIASLFGGGLWGDIKHTFGDGFSFGDFMKGIKDVANSSITKGIVKALEPLGKKAASNLVSRVTGSEDAGRTMGDIMDVATNAYTGSSTPSTPATPEGSGFRRGKKGGVVWGNPSSARPMSMAHLSGATRQGGSFLPLGGSIKRRGGTISGAGSEVKQIERMNQFSSVGGDNVQLAARESMAERMARVRSFKNGNKSTVM